MCSRKHWWKENNKCYEKVGKFKVVCTDVITGGIWI